jgi:hypothetical protein
LVTQVPKVTYQEPGSALRWPRSALAPTHRLNNSKHDQAKPEIYDQAQIQAKWNMPYYWWQTGHEEKVQNISSHHRD